MTQPEQEKRHRKTDEELHEYTKHLQRSIAEHVKKFSQKSKSVQKRAQDADNFAQKYHGAVHRWGSLISKGSPLETSYLQIEKAIQVEQEKAEKVFQQSKLPRLEKACASVEKRITKTSQEIVGSVELIHTQLADQQRLLIKAIHSFREETANIEEGGGLTKSTQAFNEYQETQKKVRDPQQHQQNDVQPVRWIKKQTKEKPPKKEKGFWTKIFGP
jgi:hypothetical protein